MKVLITGATGFAGEKLTHHVLEQGLDVRILVRNPEKAKSFPTTVEKFAGDVNNLESLVNATKDIEGVFHLAGVVGYSKAERAEMEKVNVGGTRNILDAMMKNKVSRLLHFSSVVAVGASFTPNIINEDFPYNLHPLNLGYFETKLKAEQLVLEENKKGRVDAVVVNPSTIYGYSDAKKGSRGVQVKVAQHKFPFYPPGGVNVIGIEDVCSATLTAFQKGRSGERYILSGENLLLKDVFEMIAKEAGVEPPKIALSKPILMGIGRVGDFLEKFGKRGPLNSENAWASVLYHWFDNAKAKRELQLNPRPARFAIQNSVQWMKDNKLIK